jgi:oligopeptide transport system substrate-binding protein
MALNRRRFLQLAGGGTALAVSGACDAPGSTGSGSGGARLELVLDEPATVDPALVAQPHEATVAEAVFEPLVRVGEGGVAGPAAATSWQITDAGHAYQFELSADGRWTSGEPVSSDDFVWSWRRNLSPELGATFNYLLFPISGAESYAGGGRNREEPKVSAPDISTLRVHLKSATPGFLARVATSTFVPLPRAEIEGMGSAWTSPIRIRSNGPYTLAQWDRGLGMTLHQNAHYGGTTPPKFESVVIRFPRTSESRLEDFHASPAHAASVSGNDYRSALANPDLRSQVRLFERAGTWFIVLNTRKAPWDSADVRRALSLALDREALTAAVFDQPTLPTHRVTPDSILASEVGWAPNVDEARALLAGAGYPNGDGLPPLRFTYHRTDQWDRLAAELARVWGDTLGVDVQFDVQEWRDFLDFSNEPGDFDAYRAGWTSEYRHPSNWLDDLWRSDVDFFRSGWASAEFDGHLETAVRTTDDEVRRTAYAAADALLQTETPAIAIGRHASAFLLKPSVRTFGVDPVSGGIDLARVEVGE